MRRENQNYQNLSALFDLQEQQEEVREIQLKVRQMPKSAEKFKFPKCKKVWEKIILKLLKKCVKKSFGLLISHLMLYSYSRLGLPFRCPY